MISLIRFATDTFGAPVAFVDEPITPTPIDPDTPETPAPAFMKSALLVSKVPLDCSVKAYVDQFIITGAEPANSARRLVFRIDGSLYYFKDGNLVTYPYAGAFDDIINHGNKVSTLAALRDITGFVGKLIYPLIALQAPSDADEFPTIKLALATRASTEQLVKKLDSPVYELDDDPQTLTDLQARVNVTGGGDVGYTVRLRNGDAWSNFMNLQDAVEQLADAVQFRIRYSVSNSSGSDSAQVERFIISHTSGQSVVTGHLARLFSAVASYAVDLRTCFAVIRHDPLIDAAIDAYVNFMPEPKHRELITIGTASGSRQEFQLPDSSIVPASIKLYQDGVPFFDFDFSTELSTVVLTGQRGSVITASYYYDYGAETWIKMTNEGTQPYNDEDGTYSTRFSYALPDDVTDKKISNVYFRLQKLGGTATQSLGSATGKTQLFTLEHKPVPSSIGFDSNVSFSFDEASGILSCVAAKGSPLTVSYSWLGDSPIVYSFAAGWSAT